MTDVGDFIIVKPAKEYALPSKYADGSEGRLSPADLAREQEVVDCKIGSTNTENDGCDHDNEEEVYRDQWTIYSKCPDCGAETQEDR